MSKLLKAAKTAGGCFVIILVIAMFICGPFAVMWTVNHFHIMVIKYNFLNWLAVFALFVIVGYCVERLEVKLSSIVSSLRKTP
jgi:hypothetical protein